MADINDWEEYEETTKKTDKSNPINNFESEEIIKPKEEKKTTEPKSVENKGSAIQNQKSETKLYENTTDEKTSQQGMLNNEKDFVDLAVLSVAKIKDANKLSKFTQSYIKKNLEELGSTLEAARIDELIKNLTVLFNKKRKEESDKYGKKPKSKQPSIVAGKALDSAAAKGKLDVYEDDEYSDNYEDEDFM